MEEKIKCPSCGSTRVSELVAIVGTDAGPPDGRIPELDEEYRAYRCLKCGKQFSEIELQDE